MDEFARWAAAFLRTCDEASRSPGPAQDPARPKYAFVTAEASALLESVDAGGVPLFVTGNLRRIAAANGLDVGSGSTPNDIVAALRRRATVGPDPNPE